MSVLEVERAGAMDYAFQVGIGGADDERLNIVVWSSVVTAGSDDEAIDAAEHLAVGFHRSLDVDRACLISKGKVIWSARLAA